MKMGGSLRCLFWATLYCVLYLVSASEEDLMDFDFTDLKEIDWNYQNDNSQEMSAKGTTHENLISFDDDNDLLEENQVHPFDWREKVLRTALSKALTNKAVRQKFVEVMPILRVLSKQQRLALSALITAQINAKKGNELRYDQVRMMFGDDKSLILPIVFDIANLVRNSAKKYIEFDYNLADFGDFSKSKITYERRNLELTSAELAEEDNNEGIAPLPETGKMTQDIDGLENFFSDMSDEVLDPQEINEELEIMKMEKPKNSTELGSVDKVTTKRGEEDGDEELNEEEEDGDDDITDPMNINQELQKDVPTLTLLKLNKTEELELRVSTTSAPKTETTSTTTIPQTAAATKTETASTTTIPPKSLSETKTTTTFPPSRIRRSAQNTEFVHKLVRSIPLSVNEEDLQRGNAGRTIKLNTTAFATPKETTLQPPPSSSSSTTTTPKIQTKVVLSSSNPEEKPLEPYQIVEDLAFASLNGSEVTLNEEETPEAEATNETNNEPQEEVLPTPEELIAGPRYRLSGNKLMQIRPKLSPAKRKRVQVRARPKQAIVGNGVPAPRKCERFTASMCIKTEDYPMDQIMGSIRRHRNAMTALLAEYTDKPLNALETADDFDDYLFAKKRREDNEIQGGLCQSIVRYARPQKARSASGEWKYIVNTGQHTQTLRLEKCMNPQESCSYLATSYRSHCSQVYNYHRLLSWDKMRGLHVDIFKVPTCCSCQIDGYKQQFPALAALKKDFTPAFKGSDLYRQQQDHEFEEEEDDDSGGDDDDFGFNLQHQHYDRDSSFDANELQLSSNRIRSKSANPTVGSYLSPPGSEQEYEQKYAYKSTRDTGSLQSQQPAASSSSSQSQSSKNNFYRDLARRRPQKSFSDSRSDLEYSPSEQHAEREVNVFGTPIGKDERTHQKRKHIYSVTHTANTSSSSISDSSTTAIPATTGTIRAFTATATTTTTTSPSFLPTVPHPRRPFTDTNAHQKPSATTTTAAVPTEITDRSSISTSLPTFPIKTATLPTHYFTRSGSGLKTKSRLRIPYTIASTNSRDGGELVSGGKTTDTTDTSELITTTSPQQPDIYAVNPEIFNHHYKTKFNLTAYYSTTESKNSLSPSSTSSPTSSSYSPPKRINYSYHPIIDFFEYNKRITATTTTTTTTTTKTPKIRSTRSTTPSSRLSTQFLTSSSLLYPHKIPKSVPANIYQQPQNYSPSKKQEHQQPQQNERRIGYGAAGDGSRVVFPNTHSISSSGSSSSSYSIDNSQNQNHIQPQLPLIPTRVYDESLVSDVWHPVIVKDY